MAHEICAGTHVSLTASEARFKLGPDTACLPGVLMTVPTEAGSDGHFTSELKGWFCSQPLATCKALKHGLAMLPAASRGAKQHDMHEIILSG